MYYLSQELFILKLYYCSCTFREKEHEKLLTHSDPVKGVRYGNLSGASAVAEGDSITSLGSKTLSQGTSKEKYLKSLAVSNSRCDLKFFLLISMSD